MNRQQIVETLQTRLAAVEHRLLAACARVGRPRSDVTLVAVTKTASVEVAAAVVDLGVHDLAENRPQELWRKATTLPSSVRWHLIGHLQRNKIERTLPLVCRIHSVDSLRLLEALDAEAVRRDVQSEVLLEVNASGEATKGGFAVDEVAALAPAVKNLHGIHVGGLMTLAAYEEDPELCRPTFTKLRNLRDRLQSATGSPMPDLSMGMSNDFEIAVEEGATLIRLGTVLFEGLSVGE